MKCSARLRGFSLIELMVTVAVIGFMMVLALPSLGNSVRTSRERAAVQQFVQDFTWARGAAGSTDASLLLSGATGVPILTLQLNADCSWVTQVNGTTEPVHSTTPSGLTCTSSTLTYPVVFQFTSQGYVSTAGNVTATGASGQVFQLSVLTSGSIIHVNNAS
jgi:type IV fimbrial biogenesis protein FimT